MFRNSRWWSLAVTTMTAAGLISMSQKIAVARDDAPPEPGKVSLVGTLPRELKARRARTGHLLVQAQINGQYAGWFIFDTGAGMSCVDKKIVEKLALPDAGEASAHGSGGAEATHLRAVKSLGVGPVLVENSTVVELNLAPIAAAMGEQSIDGVIGYDCFLGGVFEVDLADAKITVHDPATYALPADQTWRELTFVGRRPCVPATIEDREEGRFLLDIGANSAITIYAPTVERLKLLDGRQTKEGKLGGVGGIHAARTGTLKELLVCGQKVQDVPATFATTDRNSPSEQQLQGEIGVDLLKKFRFIVNYKSKSVALLPRG